LFLFSAPIDFSVTYMLTGYTSRTLSLLLK
jgi:hypothetical protein